MDYNNFNHDDNNFWQNEPYQSNRSKEEPSGSIQSQSMATAALILGILSLVLFFCFYIPIILGTIGIILAILSRGSMEKINGSGRLGIGFSIAGICSSLVVIIFAFILSHSYDQQDYMNYEAPGGIEESYDENYEDWNMDDYNQFNPEDNSPSSPLQEIGLIR